MKNLTLYYFNECPFCQRVLQHIEAAQLSIEKRNILEDPSAKAELIEIGGKSQVPCLVIDDKPLYESLDIINWLKENYND